MTQRKMVAALVLAGCMVMPVATDTLRGEAGIAEAQWGAALGMKGREAIAFGITGTLMCSLIPNPGAAACGIVGVL